MEWNAESDLFTGVGLNEKGTAVSAAPSNDETLEGITLLHEPSGHHGSTPSPPLYSANLSHMLSGHGICFRAGNVPLLQ